MPITEDSHGLQRFGCTLQTSQSLLHVSWTDLSREQALAAIVLVRSTHRQCVSGPALYLALEISPTRALPRYCYFPFDLQDLAQMDYLESLSATNRLSINFLGRDFELARDHELTSSESDELKKSCAKANDALCTTNVPYSFAKVVEELETSVRIPQLFERVIDENDFAKALPLMVKDLEKISPEKRALARELVRDFADALRSRFGQQLKNGIAKLPQARSGLAFLSDLQRIFGGDYDRFVDYFGDVVAFNAEQELLKMWLANLEALFKLIEQVLSAPQAEQEKVLHDILQAVLGVLSLVGRGRELSLSMLQTLLLPLKPLLSSQPGRPTKDYSLEYELKASGLSWTKVARQSLIENTEMREEFGGRSFNSLTFEHQQSLTNRIREGVRSYAERAGKPFPIENALTKRDPQEID